ncbi:putative fatty-acid-CoA ligase protein [Azorhizobium caulinodans ORS 571]|uniref:Putative fatty-acid-CoA ligase protein n=1 Tax=Azorhizobium caulinodans (strain ATCC 43989 / DSM 5975 / JCM 20966 / LMG 6465 / NBRC 14845 / NCIMB 13405 / ORS 571) TaxID=438753 RepID=A8IMG7_AZOC5|nr:AMP-binding protein [Azorhizobium caulinodans]BAF86547.1 putative fatty-acid-CoA ligase protein [Azorhizobium caulinodans ORS 571]
MLANLGDFDRLRAAFQWRIPARYNMATHACDGWAARDPSRPALYVPQGADFVPVSYGHLAEASNRFANALAAKGITRGDRVAILLPQSIEVLVTHLAVYKLGAIAVPLASAFGVEALTFRLNDSGARALVADAAGLAKLAERPEWLDLIVSRDGPAPGIEGFDDLVSRASATAPGIITGPDDPALMIYTSGTTGAPKGALHGHRVLIGHVTGQHFTHDSMPAPGDRMWTPSDWAWAGGLLNTVLSALAHGVPVVVQPPGRFDPESAFRLMKTAGVRNVFIPPTALKMMRAVEKPKERFGFNLRTVGTAGEALGAETFEWGRAALGVAVNEFYGQTECNYVIGSNARLGVARAGATGKAIPGHDVRIIRTDGSLCDIGEMGQIAIRAPDPVMFLRYWNQPEATARKYLGDLFVTGDLARLDADGYIHFQGRDDDVITSSGYRIGPSEIEDCLLRHPAVQIAAVVGKPDPVRTEIVKAVLVLRPGYKPGPELVKEIQDFVRTRLAAYEYPREIVFMDELPLTTTGKVIRRLLRDQT